jgi:transketolase
VVHPIAPDTSAAPHRFEHTEGRLPRYEVGTDVATRLAYGEAVTALGALRPDVVALDGEVSNSTHSHLFAEVHPDRYFEMYIAEQQMIAAAVGLQVRDWVPFASTFAAFFTRAYDFVRMAAISRANIRLCGSHAGVSIGADGPSQMALEDIAAFRAIHGSTVLHPSDANQTSALVAEMGGRDGICYLRTLRGKTTVRTGPDEDIRIGGSRIVRSSPDDHVTIVACGVTVGEAEAAAERLARDGIGARVLDCYSIKPIDVAAIRAAAGDTRTVLTVEDHRPEGGLGDAVLDAVAEVGEPIVVRKLAVDEMPMSGTPDELLASAGIDASAIVRAVHDVLAEHRVALG